MAGSGDKIGGMRTKRAEAALKETCWSSTERSVLEQHWRGHASLAAPAPHAPVRTPPLFAPVPPRTAPRALVSRAPLSRPSPLCQAHPCHVPSCHAPPRRRPCGSRARGGAVAQGAAQGAGAAPVWGLKAPLLGGVRRGAGVVGCRGVGGACLEASCACGGAEWRRGLCVCVCVC
jgi:hypothetical protein